MVAENENADSKITADDAASNQPRAPEGPSSSAQAESTEAPRAEAPASSSQSPDQTAPAPVEDRLKKGAKGYLMKVGKLMVMLAILGSLILGFAAYMISNTLNSIVNKIEHPLE